MQFPRFLCVSCTSQINCMIVGTFSGRSSFTIIVSRISAFIFNYCSFWKLQGEIFYAHLKQQQFHKDWLCNSRNYPKKWAVSETSTMKYESRWLIITNSSPNSHVETTQITNFSSNRFTLITIRFQSVRSTTFLFTIVVKKSKIPT